MTSAGRAGEPAPSQPRRVRARVGRGVEQIALLTLAIVFALLGFAAEPFWFVAIVIMAVLWGFQVSTLRPGARAGAATPLAISTLVEGARDLANDVVRAAHDDEAASADSATRRELYERAKEQGIPGRSSMTKDELRQALDH